MTDPIPPGWGNDTLSSFLNTAEENSRASFHNLKSEYKRLADLDALAVKVTQHLNHTSKWLLFLFLTRAHSACRAAARLATAGQFTETYMCLRGSLENAGYAIHIDTDQDLARVWLDRHIGDEELKKSKLHFQMVKVKASVKTRLDEMQFQAFDILYERAINYGAHPNVDSILLNAELQLDEEPMEIRAIYLHNEDLKMTSMMRDSSRTLATVLYLFGAIFKERYEILGIFDELKKLSQGI